MNETISFLNNIVIKSHIKVGHHPKIWVSGKIPSNKYWKDIDAVHCKNLFFRNHKGNRHYLVIIKDTTPFSIHSLSKS